LLLEKPALGVKLSLPVPDFFWLSVSAFIALAIQQDEASENSIRPSNLFA